MISKILRNVFIGDEKDANDFWLSQEPHISIDLTGWNIDLEVTRENLKTVNKVLPIITAAFNSYLPILIYCHAGIDRSPFMIACFIHEELGFTKDYAYKMVKEQRPQTIIHDDWMRLYQSYTETTRKQK